MEKPVFPLLQRVFATAILSTVLLFGARAQAQDPVDLLVETHGQALDVTLRPGSDFDGLFSAAVFTLRWEANSTIVPGEVVVPEDAPMGMSASGDPMIHGGYVYQIFAGFSFVSLQHQGRSWSAASVYPLLHIPYTGDGEITVLNDAWTDMHNGGFYISLNGVDRTGDILAETSTSITEVENEGAILSPNPTDGPFTLRMDGPTRILRMELVDVAGRVLEDRTVPGGPAGHVEEWNVAQYPAGSYVLRVSTPDRVRTMRLQKR